MERIVVVWVHVAAATLWVGGLLYTSHLVAPAVSRGERAYTGLLARGRVIAWAALGLLVLTGLDNLRRFGLASQWLLLKLLLVLLVLALQAHRDFGLMPRALGAIQRGEDPKAALRALRGLDRVLVLFALAVLFLAVGVVRGR
jgi:uncharacterized membrane protein